MTPEHLENLLIAVENAGVVPYVYSAPLVQLSEALTNAFEEVDTDEDHPELMALLEAAENVTMNWQGYPDHEFNPRLALIDGGLIVDMNEALRRFKRATQGLGAA